MKRRWPAAAVSVFVLAAALALKLAYSHAGASQLGWVLTPSCWLASQLAGMQLEYELGAGYISHHPRMVVGAACAGVNFLVVSWLSLYFAGRVHLSTAAKLALWGLASLLCAYAATVATNGLRIVLAAQLYGAGITLGPLTAGRLHRLLGIVVYCSALLGLCRAADAGLGGSRGRTAPFVWVAPLAFYLAVAIGIPLVNRALVAGVERREQFLEHAAWTVGAGCAVVLAWWLLGLLAVRLCSRRRAT